MPKVGLENNLIHDDAWTMQARLYSGAMQDSEAHTRH
jgi:hypothetical protein